MRLLGGRRSVFYRWILSYLAILGLFLGLNLVVYLQARRTVARQVDNARTTSLRQAANVIGSQLENLERLDLTVTWNPRLLGFMSLGAPLAPPDHYPLTLLHRDFLIQKTAYPFIDSLFVYFHNSDVVLSSETTCTSSLFHEHYMKDAVPTYRDWLSLMKSNHDRRFLLLGDSIAYLKSLPDDRDLPMAATLVVLMNRSWLTGSLREVAWEPEEVLAVIDGAGRVLASSDAAGDILEIGLARTADPEALRRRFGRGFLVTAVKSPVLDWRIVSVLSERAFMGPVTTLQAVALLGLTVCLLAGGLMAFSFSRRNYSRISEVARDMASMAGIRAEQGDEYAVLREAVAATVNWKAKLDSDMRQHNAAMRQNFLRRLVRGSFADVAEVERSFSDFGIAPLSPYYAVFIVWAEGSPDAVAPAAPGRRLASFIIGSAVEEIIGRSQRGLVSEYDDMLVCIVSLRTLSALEWSSDLDAIIGDTRRYLAETFGARTTVGLSTVVSGTESIPQAFQEALDALEYKLVVGAGTVIRFGEVRNRRSPYRCSIETEQQLHNAVRAGDEDRAREILALITERNLHAGDVSIQSLKCFIFDIYNVLSQAVARLEESQQRELGELIQPLMGLPTRSASLEAVESEVLRAVGCVCRAMRAIRKESRTAMEVREFVHQSHADLNLSIGMIAERFGMSQGYLSRLFRESTGQSLLEFIAGVRIARAKELIAGNTLALQDVAIAVGYTSANALIRAFKKQEGITPGRYREAEAMPRSRDSSRR